MQQSFLMSFLHMCCPSLLAQVILVQNNGCTGTNETACLQSALIIQVIAHQGLHMQVPPPIYQVFPQTASTGHNRAHKAQKSTPYRGVCILPHLGIQIVPGTCHAHVTSPKCRCVP